MDVKPTHVNRWLDDIGGSEDTRKVFWDTSMIQEIGMSAIDRIVNSGKTSEYIFGSWSEGTSTPWLKQDMDLLKCDECYPVIENIKDATAGECFLMVRDCSTKPGYVKLHKVVDGVTQNICEHTVSDKYDSDDDGRICLKHILSIKYDELTVRHGPADTKQGYINGAKGGMYSNDSVYALRCKQVPCFANSWKRKPRQYSWPSQKQLEKMSSYGCFLVGVTHTNSHNKCIEWRISFSLQERELMTSLNPTQHKCYILLKMIKKELIEPCTGESLSSYHCKTCLFYTIESSGSSLWTEDKILICMRLCLIRLSCWSKNRNCPNYFIPEENVFDKLDKQTLDKVHTVLLCLLRGSTTDMFSRFKAHFNVHINMYEHGLNCKRIEDTSFKLIVNTTAAIYLFRNRLLEINCETLDGLQTRLRQLQHTDQVTEHTPTEVRLVLSYIIPHIHLQIAQGLASVETTTRGAYTFGLLPLNVLHNIMLSSVCDLISSRLSLAAILLYVGMFDACWQNLQAAEDSLTPHISSVCWCNTKTVIVNQCEIPVMTESLSIKDIIEQHTTGCMVYLPQHANIAHPGLQFEMYRSVYMSPESRDDIFDFCFDWIVVDSKVYLYFLQYIFCTKAIKRSVWKNSAVEKLRHVIVEDKNIGHKETAYNLLGWILVQETRRQEAWQCFCRSWRIRPHNNAAKWHLVLLLNDLLRCITKMN